MTILPTLNRALGTQQIRIVDLTAPLNETTPVLQLPEPFRNVRPFARKQISAFDDDGPAWAWYDLNLGEHVGTHIDAPTHWISGKEGKSVEQIAPERLLGPAVVIDLSAETAQDPRTLLEVEHIKAWEQEHGTLPANCWILLRTGWSARAHDAEAFLNPQADGPHSPGPSVACAKYMAEHPDVSGFGVEQVGIDAGLAATFEPMFPAHYYLLGNDKYGVTSLQNLEKLPAAGATLIISPLPIEGGTGSPCRVYALVEE